MKNVLKKMMAAMMALVLTLSLAACGGDNGAENAVKGMLDGMRSGDVEAVALYTGADATISGTGEELLGEGIEDFMFFFSRLEYKIISSEKVDDDTVNVTVEVTNVDMEILMSQFMLKAMEYAFAHAFDTPALSEAETEKVLIDMLREMMSDPELVLTTGQTTLVVNKTDAGWIVDVDEGSLDVITGGMISAAESLGESF